MSFPDRFRDPPTLPFAAPWPLVMGVLNVTPDSFSDGGLHHALDDAVARAKQMVADGADVLDIGGESTRPGAAEVSIDDEIARTVPVIQALRDSGVNTPVSIDTMKSEVARAALDAGANIINDVTGGEHDAGMFKLAAERQCGLILMHMRGSPRNMQTRTDYADVVVEVRDYLKARVELAAKAGVDQRVIWIDPGFGFAKLPEQNCALVARLAELTQLGCPVLLGASRKSTLGHLTGRPVEDRGPETIAAHLIGATNGASVLRVHQPGPMKRALTVARAMMKTGQDV